MSNLEQIKKQEDRIQQEIVIEYNNTYCTLVHQHRSLIFHVPNQNQYQLISIGVLGGVSDLIIVHSYSPNRAAIHIYMEVKTPTGSQSPSQVKFQQRVEALGFDYILVRSKEEAMKAIQAITEREIANPSTKSI